MHWQWLAVVYMTVFFGLVVGTVIYAVMQIVQGDRGKKGQT